MRFFITTAAAICLLASCGTQQRFEESVASQPHAIVEGKEGASVAAINGQPPSFWRLGDRFRVPPGTVTVDPSFSDRRETVGYRKTSFNARQDHLYTLERVVKPRRRTSDVSAAPHPSTPRSWVITDRRDHVTITDRTDPKREWIVAQAPSQDYVFGVGTAREAIKEYSRDKTPSSRRGKGRR